MGRQAIALCYTLTIGCCDEVVSIDGAQAPDKMPQARRMPVEKSPMKSVLEPRPKPVVSNR
jgi:hypothetical protein